MNKTLALYGVVGLAAIGAAWYLKRQVGQAVPWINPADSRNLVNQGVESVYQQLSGSTGTIGGDFYDWTHYTDPTDPNNTNRLGQINWDASRASPELAVGLSGPLGWGYLAGKKLSSLWSN